jgi:hypothetical protein|tara:strand:- start:398 stop:769 length:372 start_codon:yes stop_codon:yes gene_type:complete
MFLVRVLPTFLSLVAALLVVDVSTVAAAEPGSFWKQTGYYLIRVRTRLLSVLVAQVPLLLTSKVIMVHQQFLVLLMLPVVAVVAVLLVKATPLVLMVLLAHLAVGQVGVQVLTLTLRLKEDLV